jgi:hypothetical protein
MIATYKTVTLWKALISNLSDVSDALDGDDDGDYDDDDDDDGTTMIYIDGGWGGFILRVSSCNPVSSSSQLHTM